MKLNHWKYYISGVLVSIITGAIFFGLWIVFEVSISIGNLIFFIPIGLLAGHISTKLQNKFGETWLTKLGLLILTIMMSIILSIIFFNLVWADFLGWFY